MRVNKFNIAWQLVRTDARGIKSVDDKIEFVKVFLRRNNSKENFARVKNWLLMTSYGYKDDNRQKFVDALQIINTWVYNKADMPNDFSKYTFDELNRVYKDLSKRKYNFQYSKVPVSHTVFMEKLEKALHKYA